MPEPTVRLDPYQVTSVRWGLANPFAGIFLDPGLGKTVIVLMIFWLLKRAGLVDWLLVVAPLRPCYLVWPEEVTKWSFPFSVAILHGKDKQRLVETKHDLYVVNYDGLDWLHPNIEVLRQHGRGWLVMDESTAVKHPRSLRHRLLKTMVECFSRRTGLTGTPLPNGYMDLFGQVYMLDLGKRLGVFISHYRTEHFSALRENGSVMSKEELKQEGGHKVARWVPSKQGKKFIDDALKDICLRFSDKELGLKAPKYNTIQVELPPDARRVYEQLESNFIVAFESAGCVLAPNAGALGIKLRQVCNGGVKNAEGEVIELHTAKADALVALVEELSGSPLLVGYEFTADKDRFLKQLSYAGYTNIPVIAGGMKLVDEVANLKRFNDGHVPVLLAQYQTVARGLNLQKSCRHVCLTGMLWDLEIYLQFIRRVLRKGQTQIVGIHELVARGTRDEVVVKARKQKDITQAKFLKLLEDYRRDNID